VKRKKEKPKNHFARNQKEKHESQNTEKKKTEKETKEIKAITPPDQKPDLPHRKGYRKAVKDITKRNRDS